MLLSDLQLLWVWILNVFLKRVTWRRFSSCLSSPCPHSTENENPANYKGTGHPDLQGLGDMAVEKSTLGSAPRHFPVSHVFTWSFWKSRNKNARRNTLPFKSIDLLGEVYTTMGRVQYFKWTFHMVYVNLTDYFWNPCF